MRIASLVPAATETLYALGIEPCAVSHACDYPPAARDRPRVTTSTLQTGTDSASINAAIADTTSPVVIDTDVLESVDPDVVVTQGICSVCAVDDTHTREILADVGIDSEVVVTHPHTMSEAFETVRQLGNVVGRPTVAERLIATLRERLNRVATNVSSGSTPSAAVLDWMDPPMLAGHWVPELVECAGGRSLLASPGEPSGPIEWSALQAADPDVLIVAPCGYDLHRTLDRAPELTDRDGWDRLSAVETDDVWAFDGVHLVNRPGPRLVGTARLLGTVLHPDRFETPPASLASPFPT